MRKLSVTMKLREGLSASVWMATGETVSLHVLVSDLFNCQATSQVFSFSQEPFLAFEQLFNMPFCRSQPLECYTGN